MKRFILSLITGSLIAVSANAQEVEPCGTNEAYEYFRTNYPQLAEDMPALDDLFAHLPMVTVPANSEAKAAPYRIPVVFHILHEYGTENVSDANVYDLMELLNEDYSASASDIGQVHPAFTAIIGDPQIEFVLAAKDPFGNCTNGIEHIYTHETRTGERQIHKVGQWDRSHYLNIWVTKEPGAATQGILLGYGTFPNMVDGSTFWQDGIVLRSTTVNGNDRTLTHEVGHNLSLLHSFGGTGTAGDGVCEDDNVADTPVTQGSFSTCDTSMRFCDPLIVENVQNHMDYASCARNFTQGQVTIMHNTLEGITGQRNILWQDTTLMETGVKDLLLPQVPTNDVNNLTVPLCAPVADFYSSDRTVCIGSFASFSDESWNAVVADRTWTFEDGSPATATSANVNVSWATPGYKKVTLTVSNAAGEDTKEEQFYIYVSPDWPDFTGPTSFDMESNTHLFLIENVEDNYGKFGVVNTTGGQGKAFKLQTYKDVSQADTYTSDWFYNYRLGESVDALITPAVDLRNTTGIIVSFKYAYATNATLEADITEELKVSTSRNCGETWSTKNLSIDFTPVGTSIDGSEILTAGFAGNADFAPINETQWKTATFAYTPNSQDNKMRIKFEFTASDLASNLFIDDINISGTLGLNDEAIIDMELEVYPNPTNGEAINVSYMAQDEPTEFILRDVQGKIISTQTISTTNSQVKTALNNTENLASSYYFLEVRTGDSSITKKVVVL